MIGYLRAALLAIAVLAAGGPAIAKPPIEAFGDVPGIRSAQLSADGTRIAYLARDGQTDYLVLHDLATGKGEIHISVTELRARGLRFIGDNYIVLYASRTDRQLGFRGKLEFSTAFSYNIATRKLVRLLDGTRNVHPGQSGTGGIVAVDPGGKHVFMPVYMLYPGEQATYDILKVNLDTGIGSRAGGKTGTGSTTDWIMDAQGEVIAREDFDSRSRVHDIHAYDKGRVREIFNEKTLMPATAVVGVSQQTGELITAERRQSEFMSLFEMSRATGAIKGPLLERTDADVEDMIIDPNRVVHGVSYSGMYPSYEMFDPALNADIQRVLGSLPRSSVRIGSWSSDWSKILLLVSGGTEPERYMLYDRNAKSLKVIASARPAIKPADVGEVVTISYKARDGLDIPGIVTWPTRVAPEDRKNLPLVVMPHGGPEAYDSVGFDWLAQFLANEGYVVLQPNFRGSAGFGAAFRDAGRRQWGRKMQDDVSDGVNAMVKMGWADPERACIVGWSYGGYAALAGGALSPDLYKCVVSIAGVSDLRDMLAFERDHYGVNSQPYTYWRMVIGDPDEDRDAINAVSPALQAANFRAPVLLIHGADDTVVEIRQSNLMEKALKDANKEVTYVRIDGDDHSLVANDSRRRALEAISTFLAKYIGKTDPE